MGKAKKRSLNRVYGEETVPLKRNEIIRRIISDIKNNDISSKTVKYIDLFGITSEELTEAGALYEDITAVKHLLF